MTQSLQNNKLESSNPVYDRAFEFAWSGQHDQAIDIATQELSKAGLTFAARMDWLNLRSNSYISGGKFDLAEKDADEMAALAAAQEPQYQARALNCKVGAQLGQGNLKGALNSAETSVQIAETAGNKATLAESLHKLCDAQNHISNYRATIEIGKKAIELYRELGNSSGMGRVYSKVAVAYNVLGDAPASRLAAQTALELCQQTGDLMGIGSAYNALSSTDPDVANRLEHYQKARSAFEIHGDKERYSAVTGNLGFTYAALGLYLQSRRLTESALVMAREINAKVGMMYWLENLFDVEVRLGDLVTARIHLQELTQLAPKLGDPRMEASMKNNFAILALAEGNAAEAVRATSEALEEIRRLEIGNENVYLAYLAEAQLANNEYPEALKSSSKAADLHREQGYKLPDSFSSHEIWWVHARALFANNQPEKAREALTRAHGFLMTEIASVRDEGLRRNYLNKIKSNRELLKFWIEDCAVRSAPEKEAFAHLDIESNPREPFKRLTDTGLRLNALHSVAAIERFLVEEATELSGGERVLLILEAGEKLIVADSMLPAGEDAEQILNEIQPLLSLTAQLILPSSAESKTQKSRIAAPLVSQKRILGYLYADMDTIYGAFNEIDRDMLAMLANQAAVALDNVKWTEELEHKVERRTEELRLLNASLEQRNVELQIINKVQLGLASKLEASAIYELVGEQLRNMFDSQAISIVSFDLKKDMRHYEYILEKGQKLQIADAPIAPISRHIIQTKKPLLINNNYKESLAAIGVTSQTIPGTEPAKSIVRMPILVNGDVRSVIGLDNVDRENAFSESDMHLLTTLANGLSVTLENALLYQEAQEARAAADAASAAKSMFLANMSHELRTPLNAIIGFARIVRRKAEGALPEKQIENVDKILSSGEHLLGMINAVLDIAKIEAGRMQVHAAKFNMNALLEQCAAATIPLLKTGVAFEKGFSDEPLLMVSDQEKVKQILVNLLNNAAKFTETGKVGMALEQGEGAVRITITDTGIGINKDEISMIFGKFSQADPSATRKYGGTGLGLAIGRNLARLLGGELTAQSEPGQGSTFILTLPLEYQPGSGATETHHV